MDVLEMASTLARMMYTGEFCSNCGRVITIDEAETKVVIGESEKTAAAHFAHQDCSSGKAAEKTWSFQQNQS